MPPLLARKMTNKLEKAMLDLKAGDVDALGTIYDLTSRGVFTFVLPIIKNYAAAEDIMQQTYIQVFEKIGNYDDHTSARNWILTIAKNLAINEFNKNKKVINFDYSEDGLIPDGLCSIDRNIDTPIIRLANEILDEEEFKIVMMYTVGEYKHREIAELLNLPLGTVTWKYKNSLNKIKTELEKREKNAEQRIRKTA